MVKKEELYYDSRDGVSRIHAIKWLPEGEPICIMLLVHGMAEYINRYDEFANFLAQKGVLVAGNDHLGHGNSANGKYGYFCQKEAPLVVVKDVHRLKKLVQSEYPGIPIFILGHSMGSFITRNYVLRYAKGIDGVILSGTGTGEKATLLFTRGLIRFLALFQGWKRRSNFINKLVFGSFNKKVLAPETSFDWLSTDKKTVEAYIKDPECGFTFTLNGFDTLIKLIYQLLNKEELNKIPPGLPILLLSGMEDPTGNYGEGVKHIYQEYHDAGILEVKMKLYEGMRHEILNELEKQIVYDDIYQWIQSKIQ